MQRQITHNYLLAFAILLGGFLRFYQIGGQPLWLDEAYSHWFSNRTMLELWTIVPRIETNPPFYYTVLKIWEFFFGSSEAGLRSLSAVMSIGCIPLVFMLGRTMGKSIGGDWIGAIAALLFAVFPVHIQYAQEARPYAMLTFGTTLTLCAFLRIMRNPAEACDPIIRKTVELKLNSKNGMEWSKFLPWFTMAVAIPLTLWLHNTAVLYIFTLFLVMLVWFLFELRLNRSFLGNMMIASSVAFLLWAPYLVFLIPQTMSASLPIPAPTFLSVMDTISWLFSGKSISWSTLFYAMKSISWDASMFNVILRAGTLMVLIALAVAGLLNIWRHSGKYVSLLIFGAISGPILMELLFSFLFRPIFLARTLIYVSVPFFVAISAGVTMLRDPRKRALVAIIVALIFLKGTHGYYAKYQKEPWDKVAQIVVQQASGDVVLLVPNNIEIPFSYYAKRYPNKNLQISPLPFPTAVFLHPPAGLERIQIDPFKSSFMRPSDVSTVNNAIANKSPVWLITRAEDLFDHDRIVFNTLMRKRNMISTWHFQEISVMKFN